MSGPCLILTAMLGFGAVHSLLASPAAKSIVRDALGKQFTHGWYRVLYNGVAVASLLPAVVLVAALPDRELYRITPPFSALAIIVQTIAGLGVLYSVYQIDAMHFAGVKQWLGWLKGVDVLSESDTSASRLVVDGLHRYVRHPLYTTSLVGLWLVSPMTINLLVLFSAVTLYFYVGSIFEERKLVGEFGEAYREYQRQVPRLVPRIRSILTRSS